MAYEQKDGEGALFKNKRKTEDKHPDLSGSIKIAGREYWLSGWTKRNDDGSLKVLSLSAKPKDADARPSAAKSNEVPW